MRLRCGAKEDRYCYISYSVSPNDSVPGMVVTADTSIEVAKDNELFRLTSEGMVGKKVS